MALSSYCRNCGSGNATAAEMASNHCNTCEEARKAAIQAYVEKNPTSSDSDRLYAGREALMQRAHHPRQTFISPREFNRAEMERR